MEATSLKAVSPLKSEQIQVRLRACPSLPSLGSINSALQELLHAEQRYTAQISEIIRRDPSLTARILRLVNSVFYGLTVPVNSIEEAVFYLGVRQIRQLSMVTPIIEEFQKLAGNTPFPWREFWQHCIGTAILSREIITSVSAPQDEADYLAGLIHDVGKIAMASAFPDHFTAIQRRIHAHPEAGLLAIEKEVLGIDHAELGGLYLKNHNLPHVFVETARFHHAPENAGTDNTVIAATQIANLLVRQAQIGNSGDPEPVSEATWQQASGWRILFPNQNEAEVNIARANLKRSLQRLPTILEGLV